MKYGTKKTNQGSRKSFGLETGANAGKHLARALMFQGASGMKHGSPNASSRLDVTPLLMMSLSTLMGLSNRSFAVLMIVMRVETFFWPCFVIFPKVIFLKSTAFLIPCSAKLLVGEMAGFFRKTKSSFLWVISRLRMLSVSWCEIGVCWYSFLNLFRISFLPERYNSGVKTVC